MYHTDDSRRWITDHRQPLRMLSAVSGRRSAVWLVLLCALMLTSCSPKMSWQAMAAQPRYEPLERNDFFEDGQSSRPLVPNTIARGGLRENTAYFQGKTVGADGKATDVNEFPLPITAELLARGRERYMIYCTPCHDAAGTGNGVIVQRGFAPPPSLHIDRLRTSPVGHYYDVITNGWGQMPSYAHQIPVRDRWAIIAYLRALQLSQNADVTDLTPEERARLDAGD